jgi:polyhydroxyalkanoate synthesis regulator protein
MEFFTTGKIIGWLCCLIFFLGTILNKVVTSYISHILKSYDKRLTKLEEENEQKK